MKRMIAWILAVMLVASFACTAVFAESGSKTNAVEIIKAVDANGKDVLKDIQVTETSIPWLTEIIASGVEGTNAPASDLLVLWQRDITSPTLPVTLTFRVDGMDGKDLFVYHHDGTEWELITKGVGIDVTATFTDLSPVGVVYHRTGSGNTGTGDSPATGESMAVFAACGVLVMACATVAVIGRKEN